MDDRQFGQVLAEVLQADLSAGTEAFRDDLLARCLKVLDADARGRATRPDAGCRAADLDDMDLGLLAAAGDVPAFDGRSGAEAAGRW